MNLFQIDLILLDASAGALVCFACSLFLQLQCITVFFGK